MPYRKKRNTINIAEGLFLNPMTVCGRAHSSLAPGKPDRGGTGAAVRWASDCSVIQVPCCHGPVGRPLRLWWERREGAPAMGSSPKNLQTSKRLLCTDCVPLVRVEFALENGSLSLLSPRWVSRMTSWKVSLSPGRAACSPGGTQAPSPCPAPHWRGWGGCLWAHPSSCSQSWSCCWPLVLLLWVWCALKPSSEFYFIKVPAHNYYCFFLEDFFQMNSVLLINNSFLKPAIHSCT